jgi:hypothetical protein
MFMHANYLEILGRKQRRFSLNHQNKKKNISKQDTIIMTERCKMLTT